MRLASEPIRGFKAGGGRAASLRFVTADVAGGRADGGGCAVVTAAPSAPYPHHHVPAALRSLFLADGGSRQADAGCRASLSGAGLDRGLHRSLLPALPLRVPAALAGPALQAQALQLPDCVSVSLFAMGRLEDYPVFVLL